MSPVCDGWMAVWRSLFRESFLRVLRISFELLFGKFRVFSRLSFESFERYLEIDIEVYDQFACERRISKFLNFDTIRSDSLRQLATAYRLER